jgi:hypothetical protein
VHRCTIKCCFHSYTDAHAIKGTWSGSYEKEDTVTKTQTHNHKRQPVRPTHASLGRLALVPELGEASCMHMMHTIYQYWYCSVLFCPHTCVLFCPRTCRTLLCRLVCMAMCLHTSLHSNPACCAAPQSCMQRHRVLHSGSAQAPRPTTQQAQHVRYAHV